MTATAPPPPGPGAASASPAGSLRAWAVHPPLSALAFVMATGILSVAAADERYGVLSAVLGVVAVAGFVALVPLVALRLARFPAEVVDDFRGPRTAFGAFAFVAASDVVGVRLAGAGVAGVPLALWIAALAAWVAAYLAVALVTVPARSVRLPDAHGGWLLAAVATQSLVVLGATLSGELGAGVRDALVVLSLLGLGEYALLVAFVVRRMASPGYTAADFGPDDWIVMGGLAISTVAATAVLHAAPGAGLLRELGGGLRTTTVVLWAIATALLPVLVAAELARRRRDPRAFRYAAGRWSTLFPLGMYATASDDVARLGVGVGRPIAVALLWIAVAVWLLAAVGLGRSALARGRAGGARTAPARARGSSR